MRKTSMSGHEAVLLQEAIDGLNLRDGGVFVDATLGNAGHMLEAFKRFGKSVAYIGIDADRERIAVAKDALLKAGCEAKVFNENFRNLDAVIKQSGASEASAILFDLGLNSEQLESSGRGFSFLRDEPLLMTFAKPESGILTARKIVNQYDAESLEQIFRDYGEERQAKSIARAIVESRKDGSINTTFELINAIQKGYRGKYPRSIHFATRAFQAIRIAANDELGALSEGITKGLGALGHGGRMAVIAFHSIEDRIVKRYFRKCADEGRAILITKKPITPSDDECENNPRARSAKLRVLEKI